MKSAAPGVLWLFEYPTLGGGERSLLAALPCLRNDGYRIQAIAPAAGPLQEALAERDIDVVPLEFRGAEGRRRPQDQLRSELRIAFEAIRPDLVHANSLAMGRLAGPVVQSLRLPCIAHLRDILKLSRRAIGDLNLVSRLLAVSAATRDFHIAQGLSAEKSQVLFNGVDLEQFQPRPKTGWLRVELNLPPKTRLVGAIGQLVLRKGHDVFARAAAQVAKKTSDVHFVIAGERYSGKAEALRHQEQLLQAFRSGPLKGRSHFLGQRPDVDRLLNEFDLLVHPSRQEPLGRVLLEAAASGTPIVATDVGGTREIFPPGAGAACLVPADEAETLAQCISELLADPQRCMRLGAAARRRAQSSFDIDQTALGLVRQYRELTKPMSPR